MSECSRIDFQLRDRVLDHMTRAVASTECLDAPFPHILVRDFFPADVYAELLQCLPDSSEYEPVSYEKHSTRDGDSNRLRFRLEGGRLERLPHVQRDLWYTIRSVLGSTALKECVFQKLADGLMLRSGCDRESVAGLPGFARPDLYRETVGYRIKPHPDTRKKVVTMQVALPSDDRHEHLGTEFYRRNVRPGAWRREPKGFDIVKTMPFLPNTAYAFVVLNKTFIKSWHGRSSLASSWGVRNSILNIWYASAVDANREIISENEAFAASRAAA